MANRLGFLVAAFGLFSIAVCFYDEELELYLDDRYKSTIQTVVNILWKSFETEIRDRSNVLIFTIPTAIDINFINEVLDKEMKERIMKSLPQYDRFHSDLGTAEERLTSNDMRSKTIFYGELEELNERRLLGLAFSKLSEFNDRFKLIVNNKEDTVTKFYKLYSPIIKSGLGVTCGVRHCAYPIIHDNLEKAPFAILTLASWNIKSLKGFTWTQQAKFALSETSSTEVNNAQGLAKFDYAEFNYPELKGCIGRVLRFPYELNLKLTFVIPSDQKKCSSSEDLWKNVQNVNLNRLKYKNRVMFVSIPFFSVSADIDMKMKLKGTVLEDAFYQESSRLYNTLAFQAAEVIFNPRVPKNTSTPTIPQDETSVFKVGRPFFFALYHEISPTPIFAGLINNPGCTSECHEDLIIVD